jgi:hypothetical protein
MDWTIAGDLQLSDTVVTESRRFRKRQPHIHTRRIGGISGFLLGFSLPR